SIRRSDDRHASVRPRPHDPGIVRPIVRPADGRAGRAAKDLAVRPLDSSEAETVDGGHACELGGLERPSPASTTSRDTEQSGGRCTRAAWDDVAGVPRIYLRISS